MKSILVGIVVGLTVSAFVHSFIANRFIAFLVSVAISFLIIHFYYKNKPKP